MKTLPIVSVNGHVPLLGQFRLAPVGGTATLQVRLVAPDGRTLRETLTVSTATTVQAAASTPSNWDAPNEWVGMEIINATSDVYYSVWSVAGSGQNPASGDAKLLAGDYSYAPIRMGVVN